MSSDMQQLEREFARMGARLKIIGAPDDGRPRVDVKTDKRGEYFEIEFRQVTGRPVRIGNTRRFRRDVIPTDVKSIKALYADPDERHLILQQELDSGSKLNMLCGHDERHWFVASIPVERGISSIKAAKEALAPKSVTEQVARTKDKKAKKGRRKNEVYIRQGEWFFIPEPSLEVPPLEIIRNEQLRRGAGSKPHTCEEVYRTGGEVAYLGGGQVLSQEQMDNLTDKQRRSTFWRRETRDATVYVRGTVRHSDHATITLTGWHRVLMNREKDAPQAIRSSIMFLD